MPVVDHQHHMDRAPRVIEPERQASRVAERYDVGFEKRVEIVGGVIAGLEFTDGMENLDDETRTVEPGHRVIAAPSVGYPDEMLGIVNHDGAKVVGPEKVVWLHGFNVSPTLDAILQGTPESGVNKALDRRNDGLMVGKSY